MRTRKPQFPVMTMSGAAPGHTVVVVAGVHGDEKVGPQVIELLVRYIGTNIVRGTLCLIPAANVEGLRHGTRDVPEGGDLNRSFVGGRGRTGAAALAHALYIFIQSMKPTIVVDVHDWAGDQSETFTIIDRPLTERACFAASKAEAFAMKFGVRMCRDLPPKQYVAVGHDKSLTGALINRAHIPAFTVELGGAPRVKNVYTGVAGVLNILTHCNMLEDGLWVPRIADRKGDCTMRLEEVRASSAGMVTYDVKPGKLALTGMRLARLVTHDGRVVEFTAKRVGVVLALGPKKYESGDQALVTLAVPERRVSWKKGEFGKFLNSRSASMSI